MRVYLQAWIGAVALLLLPLLTQAQQQAPFDFLFVDAFLDKNYLDTTVEVITNDFEQYYLPIEELATILELALTIDPKSNNISGWFISKNNQVIIDFIGKRYRVGNNLGEIYPVDLLVEDDILYINHNALSLWFGIHSDIKANNLKINFTSDQILPSQAKLARKTKRKLFEMQRGKSKTANVVNDNYQWFTLPMVDMNSQLGWQNKDDRQTSTVNYAITGSGDIGQHASEFAFYKTPGKQQLRLKLNKKLAINERDWYYEFGDILGLGNELSGGGGVGRGFSWRNSLAGNQLFSTHRFEGNAQPGWEAELYLNGALLDYQEIGENGYYLFDEVPQQLGKNNFKVVLYGPQGEQKVIEESFIGHQLSQQAGQWTPGFSFTEPTKRLLPLDYDQQSGNNINANLTYGISDQLQATLGWNKMQVSGSNNASQYLNGAVTGVWQGSVFNFASSQSLTSNKLSYSAYVQSELFDHNWHLTVKKIDDLQGQTGDFISMGLFGNQGLLSDQDNYSMALSHLSSPEGESFGMSAQYSANFSFMSLNNRWVAQKNGISSQANGSTGISTRFGQNQFRLDSQYTLWPERKIQSVTASYGRRFKRAFFQLRSNIRRDGENSDLSAQLSWTFDRFRLGTRLLVDEQRNVNAALTFSMALGVSPQGVYFSRNSLKRTATIKAMAFMDDNNNGQFDEDESPVSGISFKGNQQWKNKTTDENGVVYLPEVKTSIAQYLEFESASLSDPFLTVDKTRFNIQTHAGGLNELYFPVYQTTEIEGEIQLQRKGSSQAKAQPAVPLLLKDRKGETVKRILSEYDGFFIFDGVKPGDYRIVVEDSYLQRKGYRFNAPIEVKTVTGEDASTIEVGTLLIGEVEVAGQ